jgi:hypothetical protein
VGTDATLDELVIVSAAQPVYRFWSPVNLRHFNTIKATERDKLINNYAHIWTYEGVAYQAFTDNTPPGVAPIYRFWSTALSTHFYTIKETEKNKLINSYSHIWTYEGVAFYAYPPSSPAPGTSPVHRFWSGTLNTHFYTIKETEKNKLINNYSHIWTYESIAWYAVPPSGAIPVAVDDRVSVSLGSAREDLRTDRTSLRITITNTSATTIRSPLWVVITSISDPAVTLAGSSGDAADGYKYMEIGLPGDGQLDPAESAGTWLYFENPLRRPFNFTYTIRGLI